MIDLPECLGSPSLRVVQEYKHLGSLISSDGSPAADAPHRAQSAMSAYAPLATKIFGCIRLSRHVRLRLYNALVVSRLIYNVHVWSNVSKAAYTRLNSVYMRGLRRIAGKCKFQQSGH
eukprot:2465190-Karenia_brevis.AAC.1